MHRFPRSSSSASSHSTSHSTQSDRACLGFSRRAAAIVCCLFVCNFIAMFWFASAWSRKPPEFRRSATASDCSQQLHDAEIQIHDLQQSVDSLTAQLHKAGATALVMPQVRTPVQSVVAKPMVSFSNVNGAPLVYPTPRIAPGITFSAPVRPRLLITIPSVARPSGKTYLLDTIAHIVAQMAQTTADPEYGQTVLVIADMLRAEDQRAGQPPKSNHVVFQQARQKYAQHPLHEYIRFISVTAPLDPKDPIPPAGADTVSVGGIYANSPGFRVRRQTRDLAALLGDKTVAGQSQAVLLLEDDFEMCKQAMNYIHHIIKKAGVLFPDWLMVRLSYGMNGLLMPNHDASVLSSYLLQHQQRRPPDHLVVEWFAGEKPQSAAYKGKRPHMCARWNLFAHLGDVSTLRPDKMSGFSRCYELMQSPIVFEVEQFNMQQCKDDDLWPCKSQQQTMVDWRGLAQQQSATLNAKA